jgi:hypothetical protein
MEGGGSATLTVIGKTGIGKTRLLKNIIVQDIHTGRGIGVIDPHGDLQNELLDEIPRRRMGDLVYLDPNDPDRTVTLNVIANVPREETEGEGNDAFWTRIGSAWPHKDGKGLNLVLSALPINGRLVLREYTPDDEKKDEEKKVAKFRKK